MSLPENQESSVTLRKLSFQPAVSTGSDTMSLWGESVASFHTSLEPLQLFLVLSLRLAEVFILLLLPFKPDVFA